MNRLNNEAAIMTENLTLVSHVLCPYVQRVAIALAEKGVAHDRVTVDLADKPGWFLEISPPGRTPVLKVGDAALFESAAILEYLEETGSIPAPGRSDRPSAPSRLDQLRFGMPGRHRRVLFGPRRRNAGGHGRQTARAFPASGGSAWRWPVVCGRTVQPS